MSQFNHLNSERNLKHKVQNHEFDFTESAWEDMEKILDQHQPGPASDYGHRTSFVSFASLLKVILPAIFLFSFLGWVTIKQQDTPPVVDPVPAVPAVKPEQIVPDNIPFASNTTTKKKVTPAIQNTSESNNGHSNQIHLEANTKKEGTQKQATSEVASATYSASFSLTTPPTKKQSTRKRLLATPSIATASTTALATTKMTTDFSKVAALDLASSVDFNQHTSISEFVQADTSIFYTGDLKLDKLNFKPKRMNWGLAIGASVGNIDWSKFKFSLSPQAGVFVSYQLNEKYALQAELLVKHKANYDLNKQGTTIKTTTAGVSRITENFSIKSIWFVELPLMVKKKINAKNLDLVLGIRPSYIVHQAGTWSEKTEGLEQYDLQDVLPVEVRDGIATFDLGLLFGLEYRLNKQISFSIRYNQGFNDITKNEWFADNDLHLNSDLLVAMQYQF
ncbi:MAG: porin family protein [Saprospiraceae bacterium]